MPEKHPITTKALGAYLTSRGSSLAVAFGQIGIVDRAYLDNETIHEDIIGRIARRYGFTPERLTEQIMSFTAVAS